MTCFIISEYYRLLNEGSRYSINLEKAFDDAHHCPQNW